MKLPTHEEAPDVDTKIMRFAATLAGAYAELTCDAVQRGDVKMAEQYTQWRTLLVAISEGQHIGEADCPPWPHERGAEPAC